MELGQGPRLWEQPCSLETKKPIVGDGRASLDPSRGELMSIAWRTRENTTVGGFWRSAEYSELPYWVFE